MTDADNLDAAGGRAIAAGPGVTVFRCAFRGGAAVVSTVLLDAEGLALVDSGVAETLGDVLEPELAARGQGPADLRALLLTHADGDHAGSLPALQSACGAAVLCHPLSAERLSGLQTRPVGDGERIEAGGIAFVGLHTPGHRADMLSLYAPERRLLIASDSVQGRGSRWGGFLLIGHSGRDYRASIERLRGLDVETLIVGHPYRWSGESSLVLRGADVPRFFEESLAASREIETAVRAEVERHPDASVEELTRRIAERLADAWGFTQDASGALPPAVTQTLASELRDLGRT